MKKKTIFFAILIANQDNKYSNNQQNNSGGDSLLSIFSLGDSNNYDARLTEELRAQKRQKKKKRGIRYI